MTKKNILIGSLVALVVAYILANPVFFHICVNTYTFGNYVGCLDKFSSLISILLASASIPIFLLSLITYKMRDEVFRAWWNFARWWVPVIIIITFLLENASGGGTLGMNKDFTAFILIILYSVLVITSLVKIVRTYIKTKNVSGN